jgi:hypothetical protein
VCWSSEFLKHFHPRLLISTDETSTPRTSFHIQCSLTELTLILVSVTSCRLHITFGPGSVGGIATGYGLGGPGIEFRWGWNFPHLSRTALGPTQHPVQWVPGLSREQKAAGAWRLPLTPSSAVVKKK